MLENQTDLLSETIYHVTTKKRKELLPWWIKLFMWFFLILAAFAPIVLVLGFFGYSPSLAVYGFETNEAFSTVGIAIVLIFLLKGITSLGLLMEKDWAIKLAIADAVAGVFICTISMVILLIDPEQKFSFRLELLLLIPYLLKLIKIKPDWENSFQM